MAEGANPYRYSPYIGILPIYGWFHYRGEELYRKRYRYRAEAIYRYRYKAECSNRTDTDISVSDRLLVYLWVSAQPYCLPLKDDLLRIVLLVRDLAESLWRPPGAKEDLKLQWLIEWWVVKSVTTTYLWQGVECSDLIRHSVSSLNSGKAGLEPKLLLA